MHSTLQRRNLIGATAQAARFDQIAPLDSSSRRFAGFHPKQLKAFEHDRFLDGRPKDVVRKRSAARHGVHQSPGPKLFRQSSADHVAGEGA
jgi:hypothetical protein